MNVIRIEEVASTYVSILLVHINVSANLDLGSLLMEGPATVCVYIDFVKKQHFISLLLIGF